MNKGSRREARPFFVSSKRLLKTRERASFETAPARSPTRPPIEYPDWEVGLGERAGAAKRALSAFQNKLYPLGFGA